MDKLEFDRAFRTFGIGGGGFDSAAAATARRACAGFSGKPRGRSMTIDFLSAVFLCRSDSMDWESATGRLYEGKSAVNSRSLTLFIRRRILARGRTAVRGGRDLRPIGRVVVAERG